MVLFFFLLAFMIAFAAAAAASTGLDLAVDGINIALDLVIQTRDGLIDLTALFLKHRTLIFQQLQTVRNGHISQVTQTDVFDHCFYR